MSRDSTTEHVMPLARLRELLDAWGGDPMRWPAAERAAAEALCRAEPEAERLRRRALDLDALLLTLPEPVVPAVWLSERVLARLDTRPSLWRWLGGWSLLAPVAAMGLAGGIGLGVVLSPTISADDPEQWLLLAGFEQVGGGPNDELSWPESMP